MVLAHSNLGSSSGGALIGAEVSRGSTVPCFDHTSVSLAATAPSVNLNVPCAFGSLGVDAHATACADCNSETAWNVQIHRKNKKKVSNAAPVQSTYALRDTRRLGGLNTSQRSKTSLLDSHG